MKPFNGNDERGGRIWFFRIASLVAILMVFAAIDEFLRSGDSFHATVVVATVPVLAFVFSRTWTESLFSLLEWAKRYVQGAEGDHRHEWYSFKGQRVRVFLDEMQQPWFAVNEVAFILALKVERDTFRHYGPHEYGIPDAATESCLSESGLRRLIKNSAHPDAGALGTWLEREVLRVLKSRKKRAAAGGA